VVLLHVVATISTGLACLFLGYIAGSTAERLQQREKQRDNIFGSCDKTPVRVKVINKIYNHKKDEEGDGSDYGIDDASAAHADPPLSTQGAWDSASTKQTKD